MSGPFMVKCETIANKLRSLTPTSAESVSVVRVTTQSEPSKLQTYLVHFPVRSLESELNQH